jgi:hypothetical protein
MMMMIHSVATNEIEYAKSFAGNNFSPSFMGIHGDTWGYMGIHGDTPQAHTFFTCLILAMLRIKDAFDCRFQI